MERRISKKQIFFENVTVRPMLCMLTSIKKYKTVKEHLKLLGGVLRAYKIAELGLCLGICSAIEGSVWV